MLTKLKSYVTEQPNFFCSETVIQLHSDGAKEYKAICFDYDSSAINVHKTFSAPYTPEHNAIAERVNRTMVEAARALLIQADLPTCLWPFALKHAINVRNKVPRATTGCSPFKLLTNTRPSFKHVRVFGCAAYVLQVPRLSKFEQRAQEGVYIESLDYGVYRILIKQADNNYQIIESRHVTFDESKFWEPVILKNASKLIQISRIHLRVTRIS